MNAPSPAPIARAGRPGDRGPIRVMIVDDSLTVRTIFKRMVESDGAMEVVGTAASAERAIAQLESSPVDVVLLDLEMPGMGGLEALPQILKRSDGGQVLVVSSLTQDGAEHTVSALSMGAADTMLKPWCPWLHPRSCEGFLIAQVRQEVARVVRDPRARGERRGDERDLQGPPHRPGAPALRP